MEKKSGAVADKSGASNETDSVARKRYSSAVDTNRLLKNVKNVLKNEKTNETISIAPIREPIALDGDSRPFFYGNPFVEKHKGVLRFSKNCSPPNDCAMLCMVDVPAFFTCRELVNFVRPVAPEIALMKIIRDDAANKSIFIQF
uniref:BRAP2 domain-containing protein n=1 Tax=Globodera pallida TaxID=36090 RepID=A0A183BMQ9_GLOPA